jgi:hypothetical protein
MLDLMFQLTPLVSLLNEAKGRPRVERKPAADLANDGVIGAGMTRITALLESCDAEVGAMSFECSEDEGVSDCNLNIITLHQYSIAIVYPGGLQ